MQNPSRSFMLRSALKSVRFSSDNNLVHTYSPDAPTHQNNICNTPVNNAITVDEKNQNNTKNNVKDQSKDIPSTMTPEMHTSDEHCIHCTPNAREPTKFETDVKLFYQ